LRSDVATVIGAGVIGLLTAHELADRGYRVAVVSKEGKPDERSMSASAAAVAQFLPWMPGKNCGEMHDVLSDLSSVVQTGKQFYTHLAQDPHKTGVMVVPNVELAGPKDWPSELAEAMSAEVTELEHTIELPGQHDETYLAEVEYRFDTFSFNTGKTLEYLADTAAAKGVRFHKRTMRSLREAAELDGVVIDASGDGARELTGNNDIEYIKGHCITLRPEDGYLPNEILSAFDLIMLPREDGTIRVGAPRGEASDLLDRLAMFFHKAADRVHGLRPDLLDHCEILGPVSGYRVRHRSGGIWIDRNPVFPNILHANGFYCLGWSVGPAYAKHIADAAAAMAEPFPPTGH
jgi:glycine/D-amino acid oxidase-like deaminating enzyme